ncbi:MAG: glycine dehydrogenase [Flavobacteriales bacterium CG_4_9_14_3_um_filter_40_17]|nr:MAG: glycine dehydrogenase [Flavobacteriales bacterium CG_4_9_14_3_um_filter_40_17]
MKHNHNHDQNHKEKLFYSCDEAGLACDKRQYGELTFWEKVRLKIHMFYCDYCRAYSKKNQKLSDLFNRVGISHPPKKLDLNSKELIRIKFEKELNSTH